MTYRHKVYTVFGGSGFIGRHVVRRLAKTGAVIRVACRHPSQAQYLKTNGHVGQIVPIGVDILDDRSVAAAVRDADAVVNLVGILYPRGRYSFEAVHVQAAGRIAAAAKRAGVGRLVHVSALGADVGAKSVYARTKGEGEKTVRAAFPEAIILRPGIVFGPEDNFFNKFAGLARFMPFLPLIGGGRTRFQPVYVGDVAGAVAAAVSDSSAIGKTFELGGPRIYTFRELMELVLKETGRKRALIGVPWWLAAMKGAVLGLLPNPPLTRDQVKLLKSDNVVTQGAPGLSDLGIAPTAAEIILPTYLDRFRSGGAFGRRGMAS